MPLEVMHLRSSIEALADLLAVAENDARMSQFTDVERNGIRAGVVKNFEITYELSWKLVARWLNTYVSEGTADGVTRRELYRLAAESRLIADVDQWMRHHGARNSTVHIYNQAEAERVYSAMREFVRDAGDLLVALEERND